MTELPQCETLTLSLSEGRLDVTFNRPEVRNAMNLQMVSEIETLFESIVSDRKVRVVTLRGAGGHFCAGGDVKDMAKARQSVPAEGERDPLAVTNRRFGAMITKVDRAPQAVVAVLEGAVMGGGFGLACVADIALAREDARFRLPETGLGVPPAQIAPFLVERLGGSQARRLGVTGAKLDGQQAYRLGLVHEVCNDEAELQARVDAVVGDILRCAPEAVATTKWLMQQVGATDHDALLDEAADRFARAARGPEGQEGMVAFLQKRRPRWAPEGEGR